MRVESVKLKGVTKRFGSTMALRGASAEFRAGELTLLLGANGSGKSTLLGIVGTTIRASSGTVEYLPLGSDEMVVRSQIGWLSHDALAYGDLTGRQNVELAAELYGLDPKAAWASSVERFQLGAFANRPLRTNSRGQKQRIALARALVHQPSLLLLDEPSTGLDKASVEVLLGVIQEELARNAVVLVVAHDPEVFRSLIPSVWMLERGRMERQG